MYLQFPLEYVQCGNTIDTEHIKINTNAKSGHDQT